MLVDLVTLTDDEVGLIRDALEASYHDLIDDMLHYGVDNEDEQKEIEELLKKIGSEESTRKSKW